MAMRLESPCESHDGGHMWISSEERNEPSEAAKLRDGGGNGQMPITPSNKRRETPPTDYTQLYNQRFNPIGRIFRLNEGQTVCFLIRGGSWQGHVSEGCWPFSRSFICPVRCQGRGDILQALLTLHSVPESHCQRCIHLLKFPNGRPLIFLGEMGIKGGGDHSSQDGSSLKRTVTAGLLEMLKKVSITSTEDLVETINTTRDPFEKEILREWVQYYINWFSKQPIESLTQKVVREYTHLGEICSHGASDRELLHEWFCSLCNHVHHSPYGEKKLIVALDTALQAIDRKIFQSDPSLLIKLLNDLLSRLDPSTTVFTRETYPTHGSVLLAAHQALSVISQISPQQLDADSETGVYRRFVDRIDEISNEAHYYPFCYQAMLMKMRVHQLRRNPSLRPQIRRRRILTGVKGVLYVFQGLRALLELDFDVDAFARGFQSLQEAFARQRLDAQSWYAWMQALNHAALLTIERPDLSGIFDECFLNLKQKSASLKKIQDRKALRFGMIQQLHFLATHAPTKSLQSRHKEHLIQLAEECKLEKGWGVDHEVVEALIDVLSGIYTQDKEQKEILVALKVIVSVQNKEVKQAVTQWLREDSLEEKLESMPEPEPVDEMGSLFRMIQREVFNFVQGQSKPALSSAHKESQDVLRKHYQRSAFTKMDALFEGETPKHVHSVHCQLMLLEQVKAKEDAVSDAGSSEEDEDHLSCHHERLEWVKVPIQKDDLFQRRSLVAEEPEQDVHLVLLTGDPGTGKTTVARHLAFLWAKGEWGQEFDFVFLLQIRELQASKYDDSTDRREETLDTAIANCCFPRCDKEAYQSLRHQISEALEQTTTLLILDGLDESSGASGAIIQEAKNAKCKRLLLGRPYGVQEDRHLADIEVEHIGFSDDQLEQYITEELTKDAITSLLAFLSATPVFWRIAHVPVNAHILCALWKDPRFKDFARSTSGSLAMLYRRMAHFGWERYVQKFKREDVDVVEVFDTLGQIAFEALKQRQILIDDSLVQDQARTHQMKRMLKESGFLLLQSVGCYYQFPHLTFQEYFAGRYLARRFCTGSVEDKGEIRDFLSQEKYNVQFKIVFAFMMGEVSMTSGEQAAKAMLDVVSNVPKEVLGIQHMILELTLIENHFSVMAKQSSISHSDSVTQLVFLLEHCTGDPSLRGLLSTTLESVPFILRTCPDVVDTVIELCDCEDSRKRSFFIANTLPKIMRFVPEKMPQLETKLKEIYHKSDAAKRVAVVHIAMDIVLSSPSHVKSVVSLLKMGCGDADRTVSETALYGIPRVVAHSKAAADPLIECVIAGCHDGAYRTRKKAIDVMTQILVMVPHQMTQLMDSAVVALWDRYQIVRDAALQLVEEVLHKKPHIIPNLLTRLSQAAQDAEPEARTCVIETAGKLLDLIPGMRSELTGLIMEASQDKCSTIREAATHAMCQINPETCPSVLDTLLLAFQDNLYTIRKAAIKSMDALISYLDEGQLKRIAESIEAGFKDEDFLVRIATVETVGSLIKASPNQLSCLIDAILSASHDEVYTVRKASIEVIEEIIDEVHDQLETFLEPLCAACSDSYAHVRKAALHNISQIVLHSPFCLPSIMASLQEAFSSGSANVRKASLESIRVIAKAAPEQIPELRKMVMEAFNDSDPYVRTESIETLVDLLPFPDDQVPDLMNTVFVLCLDEARTVRTGAMKSLRKLLHLYPSSHEQLLGPLRDVFSESRRYKRRKAYVILKEILQLQSHTVDDWPSLVHAGSIDDLYSVRQEALLAAEVALRHNPEQYEELKQILFSALHDLHGRVRATVISIMGSALEWCFEIFPSFIESIVNACEDTSFSVRRSAFHVIDHITLLRLDLIPPFLPSLLVAAHRTTVQARMNSRILLQRIPLEILLESYWTSSMKNLLSSPLVLRLYRIPLTIVADDESDVQKLILHLQGSRQVEWERSKEEVENLVDLLLTTHKNFLTQ